MNIFIPKIADHSTQPVDKETKTYIKEYADALKLNYFIIKIEDIFKSYSELNGFSIQPQLSLNDKNSELKVYIQLLSKNGKFMDNNTDINYELSCELNDAFQQLGQILCNKHRLNLQQMEFIFRNMELEEKTKRFDFYKTVLHYFAYGMDYKKLDSKQQNLINDYFSLIQQIQDQKFIENILLVFNNQPVLKMAMELKNYYMLKNDILRIEVAIKINEEQHKILNILKYFDDNLCDILYVDAQSKIPCYTLNESGVFKDIETNYTGLQIPGSINRCFMIERQNKHENLSDLCRFFNSTNHKSLHELIHAHKIEEEKRLLTNNLETKDNLIQSSNNKRL